MSEWMDSLRSLLTSMTFARPDTPEAVVLPLVAFFGFFLAMGLIAPRFGFKFTPWSRIILIVVIGAVLSLAGVVALRVYAIGGIENTLVRVLIQIIVPLLVVLIVVAPLQMLLLKGTYIEGLLTTLFSVILALLIVIAVRAVWHAVSGGQSAVERDRDRREAMQTEMNQ